MAKAPLPSPLSPGPAFQWPVEGLVDGRTSLRKKVSEVPGDYNPPSAVTPETMVGGV
jgi:hypothetical protein